MSVMLKGWCDSAETGKCRICEKSFEKGEPFIEYTFRRAGSIGLHKDCFHNFLIPWFQRKSANDVKCHECDNDTPAELAYKDISLHKRCFGLALYRMMKDYLLFDKGVEQAIDSVKKEIEATRAFNRDGSLKKPDEITKEDKDRISSLEGFLDIVGKHGLNIRR